MRNSSGINQSTRFWTLGLIISLILAIAIGGWLTFGSISNSGDDSGGASAPSSATPSHSETNKLDPLCNKKAQAPTDKDITVSNKSVTISGNETSFEFYLKQNSKLVAAHTTFTMQFVQAGKDVTNELDSEFQKRWEKPWATVPPKALRDVSDQHIETPDGWKDGEVDLEVTVGEPEYWCTPKENEEP